MAEQIENTTYQIKEGEIDQKSLQLQSILSNQDKNGTIY